jgi:hypothetical protein
VGGYSTWVFASAHKGWPNAIHGFQVGHSPPRSASTKARAWLSHMSCTSRWK